MPKISQPSLQQKRQRQNISFGKLGEQRAAEYLRSKGLVIRAINWRFRQWELDIVAWDPRHRELVIVEVKTRRTSHTSHYDHASLAISGHKLRSIVVASQAYLKYRGLKLPYRVDVITVTGPKVEWFRNVTW